MEVLACVDTDAGARAFHGRIKRLEWTQRAAELAASPLWTPALTPTQEFLADSA
jgi:hypothetical protein